MPSHEVLDALTGLVARSIVAARHDEAVARYTWLDTLRTYGLQLLDERGEKREIQRRHRDWCLDMTRPLIPRSGDLRGFRAMMRQLHTEQANVRAALDFSLSEPGEARAGLDLAGGLLLYWLGSSTPGEGRQWLQRALAADPEPSPRRARALWVSGWLAVEQGDLSAAEDLLAEARELAARLDDRSASAWAVALAGYTAMFAGDLDRARPLLEEGMTRQLTIGDLYGAVAAMFGLAQTNSYLGDPMSEKISNRALGRLNGARPEGHAGAGSGQPRLHRGRAEPAVGRRRHQRKID